MKRLDPVKQAKLILESDAKDIQSANVSNEQAKSDKMATVPAEFNKGGAETPAGDSAAKQSSIVAQKSAQQDPPTKLKEEDEKKEDEKTKEGDKKDELKEGTDSAGNDVGAALDGKSTETKDLVKEEDEKKNEEEKKEPEKECVKEHIEALFSGETLSEEFKTKATTIFETALTNRVNTVRKQLEENFTKKVDAAVSAKATTLKEEVAGKVDDYLKYITEEWVKNNQVAIDSGIKAELTEEFLSGLKSLFENHYIEVPKVKRDVIKELAESVVDMDKKLNESLEVNIGLKKQISDLKKSQAIGAASKDLSESQCEKLRELCESVKYEDEGKFGETLKTLKESYFPKTAAPKSVVDTVVHSDVTETTQLLSEDVKEIVKILERTSPKA